MTEKDQTPMPEASTDDALDVRRRNVYGIEDRNVTPYGQIIGNNTLPAVVDRLAESARYRPSRRSGRRRPG